MQIVGDLCDLEDALADFLYSKIKESAVVCLEFNRSSLYENTIITTQIFRGRKAASGVSFFGPGIGKVEIDLVNFSF